MLCLTSKMFATIITWSFHNTRPVGVRWHSVSRTSFCSDEKCVVPVGFANMREIPFVRGFNVVLGTLFEVQPLFRYGVNQGRYCCNLNQHKYRVWNTTLGELLVLIRVHLHWTYSAYMPILVSWYSVYAYTPVALNRCSMGFLEPLFFHTADTQFILCTASLY